MIQPGKYRARAVEGDYGVAQTGTEQVAILFELLDTGEQITWYGYLSDRAADRTIESLITCGVTDLQTLAGLGSEEVELDIEHDTYNGTTRARVKWVNRLGSGGVGLKNRMTDGQKASFAARFQGTFLKKRQELGAGANDTERPPATGTDDDIPF